MFWKVWLPLFLVFSVSLGWVLTYGLKPKALKKINPSNFNSTIEVGKSSYLRIRQEVLDSPNISFRVLDLDLHENLGILIGFLREAAFDFKKIEVLSNNISIEDLVLNLINKEESLSKTVTFINNHSKTETLKALRGHPDKILSVSIFTGKLTPTGLTLPANTPSPLHIKKQINVEFRPFISSLEDLKKNQSICKAKNQFEICPEQDHARLYLKKKKWSSNKIVSSLEERGQNRFLLYYFNPLKNQNSH